MVSLDELLAQLWPQARAVQGVQDLPVTQAHGRVLACDVVAQVNVPSYDNSSMDGYALYIDPAMDVAAQQVALRDLPVSQRIPAGAVANPLKVHSCARIFTGAPIPAGANAVVMQEDTSVNEAGLVTVTAPVTVGQWIRPVGDDIRQGDVLLGKGTMLNASHMGLLASIGIASVQVYRPVRIGVLFTGSELQEPGKPLAAGQIYNSNRSMWYGLLQSIPCELVDAGQVSDTLEATRAALRSLSDCDVVLSSGGVSVGEEDHIKTAVELEGSLRTWKVAIKPGKPLAFGSVGQAWFFGLPGNPVSSFVTFLLVVRPFLLACAGVPVASVGWARHVRQMPAAFEWPTPDRRLEMARARINPQGQLELFHNQSSGVLTSVAWSDGLAMLAPSQPVSRGQAVPFISLNDLLAS